MKTNKKNANMIQERGETYTQTKRTPKNLLERKKFILPKSEVLTRKVLDVGFSLRKKSNTQCLRLLSNWC